MKKQGLQGPVIHWESDATGGEAAVLLSHLDPGMDSSSLSWHTDMFLYLPTAIS